MEDNKRSRSLRLDKDVESANPELPAFLARPEGAPAYHGFPVIKETLTDGWRYGAITEYEDPNGCDSGDAFVVAPDGTRAGLVWDVGKGETTEICPPDPERWGVYQVWFPKCVYTTEDLVDCFRAILPDLQRVYDDVRKRLK